LLATACIFLGIANYAEFWDKSESDRMFLSAMVGLTGSCFLILGVEVVAARSRARAAAASRRSDDVTSAQATKVARSGDKKGRGKVADSGDVANDLETGARGDTGDTGAMLDSFTAKADAMLDTIRETFATPAQESQKETAVVPADKLARSGSAPAPGLEASAKQPKKSKTKRFIFKGGKSPKAEKIAHVVSRFMEAERAPQ